MATTNRVIESLRSFALWATEWVRNSNVDDIGARQLHTRFNFSFQVLNIPGLFATMALLTTVGLPKYNPVVIKPL